MKDLNEKYNNLESRVSVLERKQNKIDEIQLKVEHLECKFKDVTTQMGVLVNEFKVFTEKIRDINSGFIKWLIGTVIISLIVGLFCQYKAFHEVHEQIHKLDMKIIESSK